MTQPFLTDLKIGDYHVKSTYREDRKSSMANIYRSELKLLHVKSEKVPEM